MKKEERVSLIIARGEHSNHCHVITGNATIERIGDDVFINAEDSTAVMRHLLESKWIEGVEAWTQEHEDITLDKEQDIRHGDVLLKHVSKGRYKYIQQIEFDPFDEIIRQVRD